MLKYKFLSEHGILILEPEEPLEAADFKNLAHEIDPYIAEHNKLSGLMIHAKSFPGWANFEAALAHMQFIERHHEKVKKLAVVSNDNLLKELPKIAARVIHAEVKHFSESGLEDAMKWVKSGN